MNIPPFLEHLPTWQGYPVPFTVQWNDGVPDFRCLDIRRALRCMKDRLCAICGEEIVGWYCFIGGEKSVQSRLFLDPAMHLDCANFAAKTCPFLNGTRREYATTESRSERAANTAIIVTNQTQPKRMAIYCCRSYEIVRSGMQTLCRPAKKPSRIIWDAMPETQT